MRGFRNKALVVIAELKANKKVVGPEGLEPAILVLPK